MTVLVLMAGLACAHHTATLAVPDEEVVVHAAHGDHAVPAAGPDSGGSSDPQPSPTTSITATACSLSVPRNTVPNAPRRAPNGSHGVGGVDEAEPRQAPAAATGLRVATENAVAVEPAHAP